MKYEKKIKSPKISRGYRLKESTHVLIDKVQMLVNGSKDAVISRAVKMYYMHITGEQELSVKNKNNSKHEPNFFKK